MMATPPEPRSSSRGPPRAGSPRAQLWPARAPTEKEEPNTGAEDCGSSARAGLMCDAPAPQRSMAGVRAAAERRAYNRESTNPEVAEKGEAEMPSFQEELPRPMSDIRAIAERRQRGFQASSLDSSGDRTPRSRTPTGGDRTPRSRTPTVITKPGALFGRYDVEGEDFSKSGTLPQPCTRTPTPQQSGGGGVYRPNHVYSGRSTPTGGGSLTAALGLKFGQLPPSRDGD
ncbi:unnamed protein product [Polarella glacialis]|uniref:Uncharacterized protein n=1 Tax=Polarella glacialis TaxID=89957 RepID=A0A813FPL2_POLGL|nr:unnamed protein product [Polarella glacialis]